VQNPTTKELATLGTTAAEANSEERIRERAYELYEARGREEGHDVEDWLEAESEIVGANVKTAA
jgi:hypothetical protein